MCGTCVSYARQVLNEHLDSKIAMRVTELHRQKKTESA
jgi:bacterioferritin-associated ferredoxin